MAPAPSDYTELRRRALKAFVGFLALTALLAIPVALGGEGEFLLKVLASTATISAASVCVMCDAAYVEHGGRPLVGKLGGGLAAVGGLLLILLMWTEANSEGAWKLTALCCTTAGFWAHAVLLRIPRLPTSQRWITEGSSVALAAIASLVGLLILFEYDAEWLGRSLAVLGILAGTATLAIPILAKLRGPLDEPTADASPAGTTDLHLIHMTRDLYRDAAGQPYRVTPIDEPDNP